MGAGNSLDRNIETLETLTGPKPVAPSSPHYPALADLTFHLEHEPPATRATLLAETLARPASQMVTVGASAGNAVTLASFAVRSLSVPDAPAAANALLLLRTCVSAGLAASSPIFSPDEAASWAASILNGLSNPLAPLSPQTLAQGLACFLALLSAPLYARPSSSAPRPMAAAFAVAPDIADSVLASHLAALLPIYAASVPSPQAAAAASASASPAKMLSSLFGAAVGAASPANKRADLYATPDLAALAALVCVAHGPHALAAAAVPDSLFPHLMASLADHIAADPPASEVPLALLHALLGQYAGFRAYVDARTDSEVLVVPLAAAIAAPLSTQAMYMAVGALALLVSSPQFAGHTFSLATPVDPAWFSASRPLSGLASVGSLAVVVIVDRLMAVLAARHKDLHLAATCVAVLHNLASTATALHPYAAERILDLLRLLLRKHALLAAASDGRPEDLALHSDLLVLVTHSVAALIHRLDTNPAFVYALLRRADSLATISEPAAVAAIAANVAVIAEFMTFHLDHLDPTAGVDDVLAAIAHACAQWVHLDKPDALPYSYTPARYSYAVPQTLPHHVWRLVLNHAMLGLDASAIPLAQRRARRARRAHRSRRARRARRSKSKSQSQSQSQSRHGRRARRSRQAKPKPPSRRPRKPRAPPSATAPSASAPATTSASRSVRFRKTVDVHEFSPNSYEYDNGTETTDSYYSSSIDSVDDDAVDSVDDDAAPTQSPPPAQC